MKVAGWFSVLPLAMAVQGALAGTNLVTDGGFESGSLLWSTAGGSVLARNSAAAFSGQAGLQLAAANNYCVNGALYTLNAAAFQSGKLYEFGTRARLGSGTVSADLRMGLIKNGAAPVYLDGFASTTKAYPDRWTRLFGAYIANFSPTDSLKLCISGVPNTPTYLDEVFVRPLTTTEIGYQAPAVLDYEKLVQADGNRLVVGTAKTPIVIKGINVEAYNYGNDIPGGEVALDNFGWKNYDESSFTEIAGLGFNTVRLMMSFVVFEDNANPGVYKEEGWAWLDRNIQWAKNNNLRLLLDMHEPPGGTQLPNQLDLTAASKTRLENLWFAIAQRYRNEPTVLGYDLINEPYVSNWFAYAPTLIGKIRAADPNHLVFIQGSYNPTDLGKPGMMYPLPFNNMVYDVHYYDTFASSDAGTTPYGDNVDAFKLGMQSEFDAFYDAGTGKFSYPLNVGEYGVVHAKYAGEKNLGAEQWMMDISAAMDAYNINRMMFSYHEERFGLYRGWQTYPGESTTANIPMKAMIQSVNGVPVTPGTDSFPATAGFTAKTSVPLSTAVESAPITIAGVDTQTPINIYGGTYSVNGGVYTAVAGMVNNGSTVKVSHTSSASYATKVSTKVIIGGAVGYFTSTTQNPPALPPSISTTSLPQAIVGKAYSTQATVSGGTAPYIWSVVSGSLPAGLSLGTAGVISGVPSATAVASFTLKVTDGNGLTSTKALSLSVVSAPAGNADMALTAFTTPAATVAKGAATGFSFTAKNNGASAAANARFELPLPVNMAWVSGPTECTSSTTQVTCSFGSLAKGVSRTRIIYLRPATAGTVTLTGKAISDTADSVSTNDTASISLTVN